jgi:hypothetical protein
MRKGFMVIMVVSGSLLSAARVVAEEPPVDKNARNAHVTSRSETRTVDPREQKLSTPQIKARIQQELQSPAPFRSGVPKTLHAELAAPTPPVQPVPTWDLTDAWRAWCDADWTQTCEGTESWAPPQGWDICRYNVVEESKAHGEWAVTGAGPKGLSVHLKSWGSHAFFDQWGGWVHVKLATAQLILATATPDQRQTLGCSYGNGGGSAGQGISEFLFCAADPTDPDGSMGIQMCADYIYENGQKKMVRGPYACGICFRQ